MTMGLKKSRFFLLAPTVALIILILDRITKTLSLSYLALHDIHLMPGLSLSLRFNPGAAFSFLADAGGWQRWFFIGLTGLMAVVLVTWLYRLPRGAKRERVALACILGGALGNLWDRIETGLVVDFILVYYDRWAWPAFNIADSAICIGASLLVYSILVSPSVVHPKG